MNEQHYRKLENMYRAAPINRFYRPEVRIEDRRCELRIAVKEDFLHPAGAVHGSVYFKALDDSAFFAANSVVEDVLVLTSNFTTYFLKPVTGGELIARAELLDSTGSTFLAKSVLYDGEGNVVARGSGTFVKTKIPLTEKMGYKQRD